MLDVILNALASWETLSTNICVEWTLQLFRGLNMATSSSLILSLVIIKIHPPSPAKKKKNGVPCLAFLCFDRN